MTRMVEENRQLQVGALDSHPHLRVVHSKFRICVKNRCRRQRWNVCWPQPTKTGVQAGKQSPNRWGVWLQSERALNLSTLASSPVLHCIDLGGQGRKF